MNLNNINYTEILFYLFFSLLAIYFIFFTNREKRFNHIIETLELNDEQNSVTMSKSTLAELNNIDKELKKYDDFDKRIEATNKSISQNIISISQLNNEM